MREALTFELSEDQRALQIGIDKLLVNTDKMRADSNASHQKQLAILKTLKYYSRSNTQAKNNGSSEYERLLFADLSDLTAQESKEKAEQVILDSLYPEAYQVRERYDRISEAHKNTFQWIFKPPSNGSNASSDFSGWLSNGNGLFWITGKPGSGKSTLMKFICQEAQTAVRLQKWAGVSKLVTASFYFWITGTCFQKSFRGLLCSLFYEILNEHRYLIPDLFPWRWRVQQTYESNQHSWTEREFLDALEILKGRLGQSSKFCFFIDGLDEFEGDHEWIVEFFTELATLPHVKFCISSRPWNVFEDAFNKLPMLKVQDLTKDDIALYARSMLESHPRWNKLCTIEQVNGPLLISEITSKSCGVFLWVYLVIRSLRDGLRDRDRITDMRRRVNSLPSDLEDFFAQILERLDEFHFKEATQFFRIAIESQETLLLSNYYYLGEPNPDFGLESSEVPLSHEEFTSRCEEAEGRINSRCRGLLEVYTETSQAVNQLNGIHVEFLQKVGFLHRTVRDFLETSSVKVKLVATESDGFNAPVWIVQATLAFLKGIPRKPEGGGDIHALTRVLKPGFASLVTIGRQSPLTRIDLIQEFDRAVSTYFHKADLAGEMLAIVKSGSGAWSQYMVKDPNWTQLWDSELTSFLHLVIHFGFVDYVKSMLESAGPQLLRGPGIPLLWIALRPILKVDGPWNIKMVSFLLSEGADPNEQYYGYKNLYSDLMLRECTTWRAFLEATKGKRGLYDSVRELLLRHGADPAASEPDESTSLATYGSGTFLTRPRSPVPGVMSLHRLEPARNNITTSFETPPDAPVHAA